MAAIFDGRVLNLTGVAEPERIIAASVTAGFFLLFGVQPQLGRGFLPEEDRPGGPKVVVLSHELWRQSFGSDPGIVGKNITLNGQGYQVVGVMPSQFRYPAGQQAWLPLAINLTQWSRRAHLLDVVGRLKAGVSLRQAAAEMDGIARRI